MENKLFIEKQEMKSTKKINIININPMLTNQSLLILLP